MSTHIAVTVLLFAGVKEVVGRPSVVVKLQASGVTLAHVRSVLEEAHPSLAPLLPACLFAVNNAFVDDTASVTERDEVACIPPVSGG